MGYFVFFGFMALIGLSLFGAYVSKYGLYDIDDIHIRVADEYGKHTFNKTGSDVSDKTSLEYERELITSIINRLDAGEIVNPSDPSILKFRTILDTRPKTDIALLIPCVVQHIKYFNQFYVSALLQTALPSEVLITFSAISNVSDALPRLLTLLPLPNMIVHLRGGAYWASENKVYLLSKSKKDLYSFFDCDDIMHPQRTEYLVAAFKQRPDMDALLHGMLPYKKRIVPKEYLNTWLQEHEYTKETMSSFNMKWSRELLWEACQKHMKTKTPFAHYCFYETILRTAEPKVKYKIHNGWLTVRKNVLKTVQFNLSKRGEDAAFNTQIINSNMTLGAIDEPLGVYAAPSRVTYGTK